MVELIIKAVRQSLLTWINSRTRSSILRSLKEKWIFPSLVATAPSWHWTSDHVVHFSESLPRIVQELRARVAMWASSQPDHASGRRTDAVWVHAKWTSWPRKRPCQQGRRHRWYQRTMTQTGLEASTPSACPQGPPARFWLPGCIRPLPPSEALLFGWPFLTGLFGGQLPVCQMSHWVLLVTTI